MSVWGRRRVAPWLEKRVHSRDKWHTVGTSRTFRLSLPSRASIMKCQW
jgi:hypothetical protein